MRRTTVAMSLSVSGSLEHGAVLHERNLNVRPAATHVRIDRQDAADSNGGSDARSPLGRAESNGTAHLVDEAGFGVKGNAKGELQVWPELCPLCRSAFVPGNTRACLALHCPLTCPTCSMCVQSHGKQHGWPRCSSLCCGCKHAFDLISCAVHVHPHC